MQFSFIKYTQPGWQFNVRPKAQSFATCLYHPQWLPLEVAIAPDECFETDSAKFADIGYRAFNQGVLTRCNQQTQHQIENMPPPSLRDEYTFLCKYWGHAWALFALLQRLLSLHNPVKEVAAYRHASKVKRINPFASPLLRTNYNHYEFALISSRPLVAVIIPTLNRYQYLKDVLHDLEKQDYNHFEVIVVDQSQPFEPDFYKQFTLNLQLIRQPEMLLWTARNRAVKATKAEYLLFFDDDLRVDPDWISQHLKCLDYFNCSISAGVSLAKFGMKVPESYNYFRWADQFDSGNALVKRAVFEKIGLFDLNFNKQSMGDGEFGIRAYVNGIPSISNPLAKRIHLKVAAGGLRQIGHWDGFRPKKWFAPKPIPSVVYLYKKYYSATLYHRAVALGVMLSNVGYKKKRKSNMLVFSAVLTIFKAPLLMFQFLKARRLANAMLQSGEKIEYLKNPEEVKNYTAVS